MAALAQRPPIATRNIEIGYSKDTALPFQLVMENISAEKTTMGATMNFESREAAMNVVRSLVGEIAVTIITDHTVKPHASEGQRG